MKEKDKIGGKKTKRGESGKQDKKPKGGKQK